MRPWMVKTQQQSQHASTCNTQNSTNSTSNMDETKTPKGDVPEVPRKAEVKSPGHAHGENLLKARLNMFEKSSENDIIKPVIPSKLKAMENSKILSKEHHSNENKSVDEKNDENSNKVLKVDISSTAGTKRQSTGKLNIPSAFEHKSETPPPVSKKPLLSPHKETNVTDQNSTHSKPEINKPKPAPKVKKPTSTINEGDFQNELLQKLNKKKQSISECSEHSEPEKSQVSPPCAKKAPPPTPVKLNRNTVKALQQKLAGNLPLGDDAKIISRQKSQDKAEEEVVLRTSTGDLKFKHRKQSVKRKSYVRKNDGFKFHSVDIDIDSSVDTEADIPPPLDAEDLRKFRDIVEQYKAALAELEGTSSDGHIDGVTEEEILIEEDIYEPIPADEDSEFTNRTSTVSLIKPMSDEDEEEFDTIEDAEEEYMDCSSSQLPPPPDELLKPPPPEVPPPAIPKRGGEAKGGNESPPAVPARNNSSSSTTTLKKPEALTPSGKPEGDWPEEEYDDCVIDQPEISESSSAQNSGSGGSYSYGYSGGDSGGGYSGDGSIVPEQDDIYEVPDAEDADSGNPEPDKPPEKSTEKLSAKEQKRLEEQKKKDERAREKLEREKKKKLEKILSDLKKTFKIEESELSISMGEGSLKEDTCGKKAGKNDFIGQKGHRVTILRMQNNPAGKWLVRSLQDTTISKSTVGYIDSKIIEVDNQMIKDIMMTGSGFNSSKDGFAGGEVYEDVEGNEGAEQDDMYEAV